MRLAEAWAGLGGSMGITTAAAAKPLEEVDIKVKDDESENRECRREKKIEKRKKVSGPAIV